LLSAYKNEDHCLVWDVIAGVVGSIRNTLDDDELRESIKPHVRKLIAKQLKRLGWDEKPEDTYFDKLLRPTILSLAAVSDEQEIVDKIQGLFAKTKKSTDLAPSIRTLVYADVARRGDAKTFEKLLDLYHNTSSAEERVNLACAITNFKQPELVDRALTMITTDDVKLQDSLYWIGSSFGNRFARDAAWKWLKENWQWLKDNIGGDLAFSRLPIYAARGTSRPGFKKQYDEFFEYVMEPMIDRTYKQGCEMIDWQSAWRKRDLAAIKEYFA
jgi:aminopeptidase N